LGRLEGYLKMDNIYLISSIYIDGDGEPHKSPIFSCKTKKGAKLSCSSIYINDLKNSVKIWEAGLNTTLLTKIQRRNHIREISRLRGEIEYAEKRKTYPIGEFSIDEIKFEEI
jgi:hypothetical protein